MGCARQCLSGSRRSATLATRTGCLLAGITRHAAGASGAADVAPSSVAVAAAIVLPADGIYAYMWGSRRNTTGSRGSADISHIVWHVARQLPCRAGLPLDSERTGHHAAVPGRSAAEL